MPTHQPTQESQILGVPVHSAIQYGSIAGVLIFCILSIVLYFKIKSKSSHSLVRQNADDGDIALMAREEGDKGSNILLLCVFHLTGTTIKT
jgi:H+/gluconate symporter-like permease